MNASRINSTVIKAQFLAWALCLLALPAQARLGEDFNQYKAAVLKVYTLETQSQKGNSTNYLFKFRSDPKVQMASPGYAISMTVNVVNGRIAAQYLAIRPGTRLLSGGGLAALHSYIFSFESIGKPIPTKLPDSEVEFKAFGGAVARAFSGHPQNVRYPGYKGQITLAVNSTGDLLVAVSP